MSQADPVSLNGLPRAHQERLQLARQGWDVLVVVWMIRFYQRYISPRKGFQCAHRVLYGTDSCSEAIRKIVELHGVWGCFSLIQRRFRDCRSASHVLRAQAEDSASERDSGSGTTTTEQSPQSRNADECMNCCGNSCGAVHVDIGGCLIEAGVSACCSN